MTKAPIPLRPTRRLSAIVRILERIFVGKRYENSLVGVLGRVVWRTSSLTSPLAGPGSWRVVRLARRLLSLVSGFVSQLDGQHPA